MQLSARKYDALSRLMESLAAPYEDGKALRVSLGHALLDLLDADLYSSYVWNPARQAYERGVCINMSAGHVERYESYFQYRHHGVDEQRVTRGPVAISRLISHEDLSKTEIYNDFLRPDGHRYGISLNVFDDDLNIGDVRIWRRPDRRDFDGAEARLLGLVEPGFVQAMKRVERSSRLRGNRLACLRLSPREAEIARLVAHGLGDKEIARRLNISFATVRTHLDNVFAKSGARSRTHLATLMFDLAPSADPHSGALD